MYEMKIGLETHIQLNTLKKLFCNCVNKFTLTPNTQCCPHCMGDLSVKPILNKEAVMLSVKAGLSLNCKINKISSWDRKNYSYPDLPKGYQITQYHTPLCENGYIEIDTDKGTKKIRIERIHIEEDAGKLLYDKDGNAFCDHNRCGVPLIEIVTKPDISSGKEALNYLKNLKSIIEFCGVSDCKMEEGSLRCDVNISVKRKEDKEFGTKCEIKNVNSFSFIEKAIEYEASRQIALIEKGKKIVQETRKYDSDKNVTIKMREKENSSDYGYTPEPDLENVVIDDEYIKTIRNSIPILPNERKKQYVNEFGLSIEDANELLSDKKISDFFDKCVEFTNCKKSLAKFIINEITKITENEILILPKDLSYIVNLLSDNKINYQSAKKTVNAVWNTDNLPIDIINQMDLWQINDKKTLYPIIDEVIKANNQALIDYKNGKTNALKVIKGQIMKRTSGRANGNMVNEIIFDIINR